MTLDQAIRHYGNRNRLAQVLGVSRQAVCAWRTIPPLRQLQIQSATRGRLKADPAILELPSRQAA